MAAGDLIIAADFGTSGVKLGAVSPDMRLLATASEGYPLRLGPGGVAEQDPQDWWQAFARGCAALADRVPGLAGRAAALSLSAQMCGVVAADTDGAPLMPCMIWMDTRAAGVTRALIGGWPPAFGYRMDKLARWVRLANGAPSKNGMDPTGKMAFIARHHPEVLARTHRFLDVKDWLVQRATGRFATTSDCANLTWLMDTRPGREGWSPRLARLAGLDLGRMPEIVEGSAVVAGLTRAAAAELGLRPETPVVAGGGDVTATALGSGAVEDGALHLALSTSAWIGGFFDRRVLSPAHSFATVASSVGFRPLLIATQECGGATLDWAARATGAGDIAAAYADLGPAAPDDPFLIPWFAGERVPVDNDALRGVIHGLTLAHDGRALRRAAVEGVALNLRWAFDAVTGKTGGRSGTAVPLVGGAALLPAMAQAVADALDVEVVTGAGRFAGVLGAAAIAAPAAGWDADVWSAARRIAPPEGRSYAPDPEGVARMAARRALLAPLRARMLRSFRTAGRA